MVHQCTRRIFTGSVIKKGHYLRSKYRFKLSLPNENGVELLSMIVRGVTTRVVGGEGGVNIT